MPVRELRCAIPPLCRHTARRQLQREIVQRQRGARWEYRPGSTLFVVWTQARQQDDLDAGTFGARRDYANLFTVRPENVFLIKVAYGSAVDGIWNFAVQRSSSSPERNDWTLLYRGQMALEGYLQTLTGETLAAARLADDPRVRTLEATVRRRDAVLGAICYAASRFLATADWDRDIKQVLARLGTAAEVEPRLSL